MAVVTNDVAELALKHAIFQRTLYDGNATRRPESHYLDFLIGGHRLAHSLPIGPDMTTLLNRAWLPSVEGSVMELLGRRPTAGLDIGRIFLFVCGECGDLGCGAVTAAIEVGAERTTWSQFAWESGFEPAEPIDDAPASITFRTADYEDVFASAYRRVAALPHDEDAHRVKSPLRPWRWGWRLPRDER